MAYLDTVCRRVIDIVNPPGTKVDDQFTTQQILGHAQAAQRWFFDSLIEAGVPRIRATIDLTLTPTQTDSTVDALAREPIMVLEKANGLTGDWVAMTQQSIPPNAPITERRYWWDWYQAGLHFNQSTRDTAIRVWYYLDATDPTMPYDILPAKGQVDLMANYAAAMALVSTGRPGASEVFMRLAKEGMTRWINMEIHVIQQIPQRQLRPNLTSPLFNYWL